MQLKFIAFSRPFNNFASVFLLYFTLDPNTLSSDSFLSEQRGHLLLLRQNSLLLLQRLFALENSENRKEENESDSDVAARMKMYRLQITSHIISSCCGSVVKSGNIIFFVMIFNVLVIIV